MIQQSPKFTAMSLFMEADVMGNTSGEIGHRPVLTVKSSCGSSYHHHHFQSYTMWLRYTAFLT